MKKTPPFRVAFFGTPEFSVGTLESLIVNENYEVVSVVSQPDRPSGRKLKLTPSPVKSYALSQNLDVVTPESCRDLEFINYIKSLNLDVVVVVAFGQILNQKLLDSLPQRFVNLHASLLPRWRGAAPIQRAIMDGDSHTGVSLQVMVKKLDAGAIIAERQIEITPDENSIDLHNKLAKLGAQMVVDELKLYLQGELQIKEQDESLVTYAQKIEKNETWINWSNSAFDIWNHIRGLALGPGGTTLLKAKRLKVINAKPQKKEESLSTNTGEVTLITSEYFVVQCGFDTELLVYSVQPESKPIMSAQAFINGGLLNLKDKCG